MRILREEYSVVYLNLAACYLLDDTIDTAKVIENCNLALKIDGENIKALYRKGQAHLISNDLDAATIALKKAAAKQPNDKAIRQVSYIWRENNHVEIC